MITPPNTRHAGTYNGNPVSLAARLATMTVLSGDGVYRGPEARGRELADGMRAAMARHGVAGMVNQVGPVCSVCSAQRPATALRRSWPPIGRLYDRLSVQRGRRGIFALPGGRWYLSTAHTAEDVSRTVAAFDDALFVT